MLRGILLCLIDLAHVDIEEGEGVVFAADDTADLQEADLGALSEALEHARRRHNVLRFVPETAVQSIAPTVDELIGGGPGESMAVTAGDVGYIGVFKPQDQCRRLHLLHGGFI